ncbi:MAG: RlmE family RNA methyltransferase [Treponema sp.]|jgi:23S rRNA (uridine2552-2'-O)-methyltransferase|nr:RlmE family RNA methyltransferase [Treponema sp.]
MADYKKPDYWQQKAREEGYPARSVYKLKEIDEKFNFFKAAHSTDSRLNGQTALNVLDLGAAPGSWSLYVLRKMAVMKKGALVSVDLSPLSREFDKGLFDGGNFFFIQGDITTAQTRETISAKGPYSAIISDAAPATTGNHTVDAARSLALAEEAANYAENALSAGGSLVVKIFQGGDSAALLKRMKTLFETAKSFKPQACRGESVETYFIGLGKR